MSDVQIISAGDVGSVDAALLKNPPVKNPGLLAMLADARAKAAVIEERLAPARAYHDAHRNDPKFAEACATIRECNAELFPLKQTIAALSRALGAVSMQVETGEYKGGA